jgi:hypothetical protein
MKAQIDLNHAGIQEIERAFHSRQRANQVLNKRELLGDFRSWDDVKEKLPGISDELVRALREAGVTIGRETASATPRRGKHMTAHRRP